MFRSTVGSRRALSVLAVQDLRGCQRTFLGLQKNAPLVQIHKRSFSEWTKDERFASKSVEMLVDVDIGFGKKRAFRNLRFPEQGHRPADWKSMGALSSDDIDIIDKRTGESLLSVLGKASDGRGAEATSTQTYRVQVTLAKEEASAAKEEVEAKTDEICTKTSTMTSQDVDDIREGKEKSTDPKGQVGPKGDGDLEGLGPVEWNKVFHKACASGDVGLTRTCLEGDPPRAVLASVDVKTLQNGLHLAAGNGHHQIVKLLIEAGLQLDSPNKEGSTPLHCAASGGHTQCLKLAIQGGATLTALDKTGSTALHKASEEGHLYAVEFLLQVGLSAATQNINRCNSLHLAAINGRQNVVQYIVEEVAGGRDLIKVPGKRSFSALHCAAEHGHLEVFKYLWAQDQCNRKATSKDGKTAFHMAVQNGHRNIVEFLVDEVAGGRDLLELQEFGDESYESPLHWAAACGDLEVFKFFWEQEQLDRKATDEDGDTALHWAARFGRQDIVEFIVEEVDGGCSVLEERGSGGRTALHEAADNGHAEVVKYLLSKGSKLDPVEEYERQATPLLSAAAWGHLEVVKVLVEAGGFEVLEVQGQYGCTALHWAALRGHADVVQYLISKKVNLDPVASGDCNLTPLHYAVQEGRLETVKVLVAAKCDTSRRDRSGRTALGLAKRFREPAVAEYLKSQGCPE